MAERRPRLGVLPARAFDLRPGPCRKAWDFDRAEDCEQAIRCWAHNGPTSAWGAPRARTGAASTYTSITHA
eukprot:15068317-Alexandrium_andersonii.AAC.1